ncbi:hypothetical protein QBC37DRAFT_377938 [Rhypophila decipiens]|uniref:Uncharacterized protein n=1 Tax=Rhypophila decipiens TaxID=261697 RepID=A0AAN7B1S2_9PEZI|nr:hypothetical protein QBC37DRAFT_377938 [Rhypophila decipiens]
MNRDKAPNRARLQVRNSHQTHRRTRSGELSGGIFSPPYNTRQLHSSKSQTWNRTGESTTYMLPEPSSSFLLMPTPEPSPIPKIAILPESPMKERERSDSVATSSSCYSTDSVAIGPHVESDSLARIVPMSPEEAAVMMAAHESSFFHVPSESSSSSTASSTSSRRSRSSSGTPRTPTTPKTPTPQTRHSPPRYSLFPQISHTPQTCPPPKILRSSASSTELRPPRVLRASSSSAALRPPPENGYGHLRSRSEGLRPISSNPMMMNFSQSKATDVGMDAGLKLATNMALSLTHALPGTHVPGMAHTHEPRHHHARLGEQHYATIPEENRRQGRPPVFSLNQHHNTLHIPPGDKINTPISTDEILDLYQDEHQNDQNAKIKQKRHKPSNSNLSQDWEGFLEDDDDDDDDSEHEHGHHGWQKGHRRRQTLANALKPKNWF